MRERWQPVAILAAALFVTNLVARVGIRIFAADNDPWQVRVGLATMSLIAAIVAVCAFLWARRHPMGRTVADLGAAVLAACVLSVLVGPFVSGTQPFAEGAGAFFALIWQYLAFALGGAVLGIIAVVGTGLDHRSQALKRYAESQRIRQRRAMSAAKTPVQRARTRR
ncbi:MAG TPA: hypothetical protein VFM54_10415 [Micromonosporaceae bacterium]|nr:hypothetical protein [Micromonosporaceae bacterium]